MNIKPDSDANTLNPRPKGVLPSSTAFGATTIDTTTLRMCPSHAEIAHPGGHIEDVDGDGLDDRLMRVNVQSFGADTSTTRLRVTGLLADLHGLAACDSVALVGAN